MNDESREGLANLIRSRICAVCPDRNVDGSCYLPLVVEAIEEHFGRELPRGVTGGGARRFRGKPDKISLLGGICGCFGASTWCLTEEAAQFAAGGIEGALLPL